MTEPAHAPAWYPDPQNPAQQRWWDGAQWTENVQPAPHGTLPAPGAVMPFPMQQRTSVKAILSLVLPILLGILGSIPGLILGILALKETKRDPMLKGRGIAIAGTIVSALVTLFIPVILFAVAIPVFLGQKSQALETNAKNNIKVVFDAAEACAASRVDGSGCTGGEVADSDPTAAKLLSDGSVSMAGSRDDYEISAKAQNVTYRLERGAFTVKKTCEPAGSTGCPSGTW